jgi:two-component system OmpR family sensor kinase
MSTVGSAVRSRLRQRLAGWPLRRRLLVALLALLAAVCLIVGAVSVLALRGLLIGKLDAQLLAAGERSSSAFLEPPPTQRPPDTGGPGFLLAPGQGAGTLGAVLRDGQVRVAAVLDPTGVARLLPDRADHQLLDLPVDGVPRTLVVAGREYRAVAVPTWRGDVLVTGLPLDELNATVGRLGLVEVLVAAGGLLVAGGAGVLIVRATLRPLRRVAATAGRVAELPLDRGDVALAERVPEQDTDPRTEVGQVGAALNHMLNHVAAALEARHASETQVRQFVADASHELRTPLAAIRGYSELIERRGDAVPDEVSEALRRARSQTERMTSLVEDMLLLARLDAGRPLQREAVDLSQLVVDSVSDAHAAGPGHHFTLDLPDDPVTVTGDATRLGQVLANLLANARTHTPPGTTVVAGLAGGPDGNGAPAGARIWVADQGPGIPVDLLPHVFERFARADAGRSRAAGSTGLGLSIVHAVVAAHGGRVTVESAPGRTVFTVHLP